MSAHFLQQYGYFGVAIALILEFLFIPFPAETILVISGLMLHKGFFSLIPLLIVTTLSSWAGSQLAYGIGYKLGRPVLLRFGKYVKLTEQRLNKVELRFRQYSILILGIGRFIAGIRVLIAYVAGLNRMGYAIYSLITLLSAAVWSAIFILIGGTIGAKWHVINHFIRVHHLWYATIAVVIVALIAYLWLKRRRREPPKPEVQEE
jgi:membrane protein DedA with SNARE-associated domain